MALVQRLGLLLTILWVFITLCQAGILRNSEASQSTDTAGTTGNETNGTLQTLPIVTWKWHHVETPYLVALWVLVCWLCKLGKPFLASRLDCWMDSAFLMVAWGKISSISIKLEYLPVKWINYTYMETLQTRIAVYIHTSYLVNV